MGGNPGQGNPSHIIHSSKLYRCFTVNHYHYTLFYYNYYLFICFLYKWLKYEFVMKSSILSLTASMTFLGCGAVKIVFICVYTGHVQDIRRVREHLRWGSRVLNHENAHGAWHMTTVNNKFCGQTYLICKFITVDVLYCLTKPCDFYRCWWFMLIHLQSPHTVYYPIKQICRKNIRRIRYISDHWRPFEIDLGRGTMEFHTISFLLSFLLAISDTHGMYVYIYAFTVICWFFIT